MNLFLSAHQQVGTYCFFYLGITNGRVVRKLLFN